MENSIFHCLTKERKWGGRKTLEKVFSPGPTIFILPNREENLERKCCESTFTEIPSPNVHNNPARQNKKEAKNNHQTQHHTKHRNLAQKTKTYHNQNRNSKPNQKI